MVSKSFVQPTILRFDGHYDHWSMLMENFFRSKEYWQVIESGVATLTARATLTKAQKFATQVALIEAQKTELEGLKLKDLKAKNLSWKRFLAKKHPRIFWIQ